MRYPRYVLLLLTCTLTMAAHAQQLLATYVVKAGKYPRQHSIVTVNRHDAPGHRYQLVTVEGGKRKPVQIQIGGDRLAWEVNDLPAGKSRTYELWMNRNNAEPKTDPSVEIYATQADGGWTIKRGSHPILHFHTDIQAAPTGVDPAYARGGFIHPAWTPGGKVLTNIQPKDHYHHYGIWNPWTDTEFEGKTVDFWNLAKKTGTVRVSKDSTRRFHLSGPVWGGIGYDLDHVALNAEGGEKTAITEYLEIIAYGGKNKVQVWDYRSTLECASNSPILLKEYRYGGGFAIRAAAEWNNENSSVLSSEGKTRKDADNTHARWFKITGSLTGGQGGILVLCSPENFNFPQPLRVWPEKDQQGQVFAMFSPTKDKPWQLTPGQKYKQRYRVITYDGDITAAQAEAYWNDYASPPEVTEAR